MPFLQRILAAVMLFSSAVYGSAGLANPEEAEAGKVQGFTGLGSSEPLFVFVFSSRCAIDSLEIRGADSSVVDSGDTLTGTFCYCEYPPLIERVSGPAHWYQFEYYNKHHNTTFVLTSACPDGDIGFDKTCVPSNPAKVRSTELIAGYTMAKTCKLWKGYEETIDDHFEGTQYELCYMPNHKHSDDYIQFNKQKRNLGPSGGQSRFYLEANETCRHMCKEFLDLPLLDIHYYPPSHQIVWDLDDMCEDCA